MSISGFTVRRPVFTVMATLIVVILGIVAVIRLPIDLMPDISYPTLSILTSYQNASPEVVEQLVTRPIEEAMSAVPGVEELYSVSSEGSGSVRLSFAWGTDLEAAAVDVRERLDRVTPFLPDDAERPRLRKFDPSAFPIMLIGAFSNLDPVYMRELIDKQVAYRLARVPGVAAVDVWGGLEREIQVNLDPDRIKALGIPVDQIVARIRAENLDLPAGIVSSGLHQVNVRTPGNYTSLDELKNTVVSVLQGVPIQLRQIADVEDSWRTVTRIARINGKPGIRIAINKQSGKNTVEVGKGVLKELQRINQDFPQISLVPLRDSSAYIKQSINTVGQAAIFGGIFAVFILLIFLRNLGSTAIIGAAIPISIIATFALMYFSGFTLNIMTLGGLALGIGMLVDNSIVVLENIYRLRESGETGLKAAVDGSGEVTSAVIASTMTTLVVFLPLIFLRGLAGVMFKQLAVVVSFSLACSLAVALTLVPMLASRFLHIPSIKNDNSLMKRFSRGSSQLFAWMESGYRNLLSSALKHRGMTVGVMVMLLAGSITLAPLIGFELMPSVDQGQVRVSGEMDTGTRLEVTDKKFREVESIVMEAVPEAQSIITSIGGGFQVRGSNTGQIIVNLNPVRERNRSEEMIAMDLRKKLGRIPGMLIRTRTGGGFFLLRMGSSNTERVQIEVRGYELDTADALARQVLAIVEKVEGITDAQLSRESGIPEELILINRQKAADMKLTVSDISNTLQTILSGKRASYYREGGREYDIMVKLKNAEMLNLEEVLDLTLTNAGGQPVVLRNVVSTNSGTGPVRIERRDQERIVTVFANISGRDLGSVARDIKEELQKITIPRNFGITIGGDYEEQQKAFRELILSILLALVLIYMVMASLYESLLDPFVVMFSIPFAAIGVILMLLLTRTTLNIQSGIGVLMLGGIVVNNAILLVDHTKLLRRRDRMPLKEAIEEAGRRRLRPILMTALTTIFALIPLALGFGEGGQAQAPLARAVIGGLISSAPITLVLIPTLYYIFEKGREKGQVEYTSEREDT